MLLKQFHIIVWGKPVTLTMDGRLKLTPKSGVKCLLFCHVCQVFMSIRDDRTKVVGIL